MGFFSEQDIEISEMVSHGSTRDEVLAKYPFLTESELDTYFGLEYDSTEPEDIVISYDDLMTEPEWTGFDEEME